MKTKPLLITGAVILIIVCVGSIFLSEQNIVWAESLWENRVDGIVRSVDITNNGQHVVAGTEIADKKGDVYLFDNFGTLLWKKDLDRIIGDVVISKDDSLVLASGYQLSSGPGKFYMNPSVYLFDIKGNLLWQYQNVDNPAIDDNNQFLRGTITPDNHIIIQSVHQIMLLDKSKNQIWNYTVGEDIGIIKISPDGTVIAASSTDYSRDNTWAVYVLDSQGHLLWKHIGHDGTLQWSAFSISSGGDKIIAGSMPNGDTGTLYLFDKTGNMLWKHDVLGGILNADMSDDGSSIVVGTNNGLSLFIGSGENVSTNSTWAPNISPDGSVIVSYGQLKDGEYGVSLFDGKLDQIWQKKILDANTAKISGDNSFVVVGTRPVLATGSFGEVFLLEGVTNKTRDNATISQLCCGEPYNISKNRSELNLDSPLKQFKSGVPFDDTECKENLVLVQKYNGYPACVYPNSAQKLYERGWTLTLTVSVNQTPTAYDGPTDIPSANNQFALNFYSYVAQDKKSNVFFSPASIFTAFAIVYEGAKGNTASEIKDVFGFDPDESKRRSSFANMQNHLNMNQQNNTISLANALWVAENFSVLPEYADTVKTYYESEIKSVDFSSKEKGIDVINLWIDEKTHGKIEKIFEELDPATKLVITNAIYFKGMWEESFDKTKTTVGNFHVSSDNTVQVPMMESKTTFPNVAVNDLVKIVELPYQGEKFSMLILLPKDVDGMDSLEESLSVDNLNKWKGELQKMKTKVHMPKFKLETEYDLKSVLHDMGIYDAFDNADFTGISNSGLHIEKAVHKAFVEVNEEGTEAAAATGIAMLESGPFEFTVDRPFIFIIQDNETGSILFIGKVVDPLQ